MNFFHFISGARKSEIPECKCSKCNKLSKTVVNLSMLATSFCFSQKCDLVLEGRVVDLHDNLPLSVAVIEVLEGNELVFTDDDGRFIIENQCLGKINLKISHPNCEDLNTTVDLKKSTSREFYLEHHFID